MVRAEAPGKAPSRKRSPLQPAAAAVAAGSEDEELREYLREWRRGMAKEKNTPAYIVLHDSSLDEICRRRPKFYAELLEIPGIGERKAELYGNEILDALKKFVQGQRAGWAQQQAKPADETMRLLNDGKTLEEIAQIRGRQISTIVSAVAKLLEAGLIEFQEHWVSNEKRSVIEAACARMELDFLKPLKDVLPPEITYDEIKLVVARMRRERGVSKVDVPA
jgi:ATP-dependent DNA helicase RecQ